MLWFFSREQLRKISPDRAVGSKLLHPRIQAREQSPGLTHGVFNFMLF